MQNRFVAIDDERVACIVSALEASNGCRAVRQQIDNLSLAFVTPLGADDDDLLTPDISAYLDCCGYRRTRNKTITPITMTTRPILRI